MRNFGGVIAVILLSSAAAVPAFVLSSATASAAVVISSATTKNINCIGGVCAPTAKDAVLNARDLMSMLASGDVEVNTGTGSLRKEVRNIDVKAGID